MASNETRTRGLVCKGESGGCYVSRRCQPSREPVYIQTREKWGHNRKGREKDNEMEGEEVENDGDGKPM